MHKKKILSLLLVTFAVFLIGSWAASGLAEERMITNDGGDAGSGHAIPRTRCTYLSWPKFSSREIRRHKANPAFSGARCSRMYAKRTAKILPNKPPVIVSIRPQYTLGQPEQVWPVPSSGMLTFTLNVTDPDGDTMLHTWSVTGGRVMADGGGVVDWDLRGTKPGTYTITAEADDGCGCIAFDSASVAVEP